MRNIQIDDRMSEAEFLLLIFGSEQPCAFDRHSSETIWWLSGSVEEDTSNKLLSVPVKDRTPNLVFACRRKKPFKSDPIYTSVPKRETRMRNGPLSPNQEKEVEAEQRSIPSNRFQLSTFR